MVDERTVAVVYANVCVRCEVVIIENVKNESYTRIQKLIVDEPTNVHVYHDRNRNALFRKIISDRCRSC